MEGTRSGNIRGIPCDGSMKYHLGQTWKELAQGTVGWGSSLLDGLPSQAPVSPEGNLRGLADFRSWRSERAPAVSDNLLQPVCV